jgi:hypothetical protein
MREGHRRQIEAGPYPRGVGAEWAETVYRRAGGASDGMKVLALLSALFSAVVAYDGTRQRPPQ